MSTEAPLSTDLLIVGGGPAGAACAIEACRLGVKNVLVLEKAASGRLKACAGGLSPRGMDAIDDLDARGVLAEDTCYVDSARLSFAKGKDLILAGDETMTVKNRARLDSSFLDMAQEAGAEVRFNLRAEEAILEAGRCRGVSTAAGDILARLTVFAAGAGSGLVRDTRRQTVLTSCTAWYRNIRYTPGRMEMIFPPEISPHYMWLFPEAPGKANIGMCLLPGRLKGRNIFELFDDLVDRYFADGLVDAEVEAGPLVHPLRSSGSFVNFAPAGAMVCGEQAGLVSAYTGEGISVALESGGAAGRAAADILRDGDIPPVFMDERIRAYEKEVRRNTAIFLRSGHLLCRTGPALLLLGKAFGGSTAVQRLITKAMTK